MNFLACSALALAALGAADVVPPALEQQLASEAPAALARSARERGDASRGALLFHQPSLGCARCHVAELGAKPLGPDLAMIGKDATDAYLVESILAPSKSIKKGFETVTIARTNGEVATGLLDSNGPDAVVLRDPNGNAVSIPRKEIEQRVDGPLSLMPAGLVNQLATRDQFLDLLRYLREIADGGPDRARQLRPSPGQLIPALPDYERDLDHAGLIASFGPESYQRGKAIYERVCANCHGTKDKPGSMPTSLRFGSGVFKNGSDPYRMYQTITLGFGQMAAQGWMVPRQKYDVIHYIRETYLKPGNPSAYVKVDRAYVGRLPRGSTQGPAPSTIERWSAMDYGPALSATYEVGDDGSNFAYKGIAVRLDAGQGGVSRGSRWIVYDHDTMRMAASWSGAGFIDWHGINFNGQHGIHPRIVGQVKAANPNGPGWANPLDGSFADPRPIARDGRTYGPLPRSWAHYQGQYRHGDRAILAYTIGETSVLEMPSLEGSPGSPAFARTIHLGPRPRDLILRVARRSSPSPALLRLEAKSGPEMVVFPAPGDSKRPREPVPVEFRGATRIEVEKPEDFDLTGSDFTIAARFQTRRGGTLFAEAPDGEVWVPDGKSLFVRNGRLVFDIGWVGAVESRRAVADGRWHDVAATFEHATGRVRLFIDGKADRDGVLKPHGALAARSIRIGFTAPDFPVQASYFSGKIAEVRFYRTAFPPDSAARLLEADNAADRLVGRWKPDDARGDFVADATGKGHRGKVFGRLKPSEADGSILAAIAPSVPGGEWIATPDGDLRFKIPAGPSPIQFTIALANLDDGANPNSATIAIKPAPDLPSLTRGGPARWPDAIRTKAMIGRSDGPFAVNVLTPPNANPWLCQMRLTGFDFFPDGRAAAVCSWDGDVWRVEGLDDMSKGLTWRRIASGLFQPLGLKILGGRIYVGCRDQIAILRDLNGDGETDFYESFNSDHQVTDHFHEFAMDLQADSLGNLYYAKAARHGLKAVVPQHGTLLRVSRDGLKTDILATGFRAPNGVGVNGDGTFFLTDQEGFWTPKNRINWVKPGGFYGNMWGYTDVTDPSDSAMEQPVCWITNAVNRSPAEVLRVERNGWGPLKGALLNLSYGEGKIFVVPNETIDGHMQGGVAPLPLPPFPTGVMRGRFHPVDGQLYACGMFAWGGNRPGEGGFYRVRYTGKAVHLPIGLNAKTKGMLMTFSAPIDPKIAADPSRYSVKTWSLKRSEGYGSKHIDERPSRILAARPTADGRGVFLELDGFQPVQCMEIKYSIRGEAGEPVEGSINNSVYRTRD